MTFSFSEIKTIKPSDVYGAGNLITLINAVNTADVSIVGFKPPDIGDLYINVSFEVATCIDMSFPNNDPRFIVKRNQKPISVTRCWE